MTDIWANLLHYTIININTEINTTKYSKNVHVILNNIFLEFILKNEKLKCPTPSIVRTNNNIGYAYLCVPDWSTLQHMRITITH